LHPLKVKIKGAQIKEIKNFTRDCFIFLLLGIVQGSFNTRKSHTPAYSSEVFSTSIGKSFNLGENVSIETLIPGGKMGEGTKKSSATRHESYDLYPQGICFQETFKTSRKTAFVLFREAIVILAFFCLFLFVFRSAV